VIGGPYREPPYPALSRCSLSHCMTFLEISRLTDVTGRHQRTIAGRGFLESQPSSAESGEVGVSTTGDPVLAEYLRMSDPGEVLVL
jgi:hypothetical protein